ncbi:MFS transporter [Alkalicoccobacillus murimartini]|uniref:PPP family 3-phenylpropionic acid transporter n=1 Tax=Alkalicoccobacillus murimartini TaxID=171685 RepID=A0ABT9YI49_9BACI|nr:MFS transporter [Alkalicoccobacillus murimartini]MDQ0207386.1 PPP family 3-phenylpropionic acid transporter [Alkalicoccobacillus murimartini]
MNTHRWMSTQFFSFFLTWGIFLPYWTGWLVYSKELSVTDASFIMSMGLVARGLSTLFAFPYLSGKFSNKIILRGAGIGTLIAVLCYIPAQSFSLLLLVTIFFHFFYPPLMPILDTAASRLVQHKQLEHYGKSRQWGSIGFVLVGIVLSLFIALYGEDVIYYALLLGVVSLVYLAFRPAPAVLSQKPTETPIATGGLLKMFHMKHFWLVLLIVILLQAAHASYYNYGYLYLQEIQAPDYLIGLIINIAVLAEILFFTTADRKFKRFSIGSLLAIAAFGSTLRWILVFAFPSVIVFSIAQVLHACSFAMAHYAFMKYLIQNIPPAQIPKVQGLYSALALSWSTAVFTLFGGYLYDIKPGYAFLGMIVCTVPALVLAMRYRRVEKLC